MNRLRHPRGFTIILALTLLALVTVAATLIVHQLDYELRRTRTDYEDAQLRQLLLAAAEDLPARPDGQDAEHQDKALDLPRSLLAQHDSVSMTWITSGPHRGDCRVVARLAGREADQVFHFDQSADRWQIVNPDE